MTVSAAHADAAGTPDTSGVPALLRLDGVSKHFPGVVALDGVDFDLRPGEVHVLFGENGAGKSTLISLAAGVHRPSHGRIRFRGEPIELASVHQARQLGISAVFQEFSLVPQLTVEENLFLGAELMEHRLLDKRAMHAKAREIIERLGFPLKPRMRVAYLSRAEQQMVEIAKAFRAELSVLILDEPTASLTERETERLFGLIQQAKRQGVGIIYITHRMAEIKRIGDRVTVLRDGRHVATLGVEEVSETRLVELMTGRVIAQIFPEIRSNPGEMLLDVQDISTANGTVSRGIDPGPRRRSGRAGGPRGLRQIGGGAGLFRGGEAERREGRLPGRGCHGPQAPRHARPGLLLSAAGPARRGAGDDARRRARISPCRPSACRPSPTAPSSIAPRSARRPLKLARRLNLQPLNLERPLEHFSGGNQQKVLLAKALSREVRLFVFDEPTVGVDVGTRVAIYQFIRDLCEAGAGILLISSDLPEILHLTHRAYVMYRGQLRAELTGAEITEDKVLRCFFEREAA